MTAREIGEGGSASFEGPTSTHLSRWRQMIWQSPLKGHLKLVALAIAECCDPGAPSCSPSLHELHELVTMSYRTLIDALAELETVGYVQVDRDPEYVDEYHLAFPIEDER